MGASFKLFTVVRVAFANNTAIITAVVASLGRCRRCLPPLPLWCKKRKSTVQHIFISFFFGNNDGEFDGECDCNNNGNGSGDDLSSSVL